MDANYKVLNFLSDRICHGAFPEGKSTNNSHFRVARLCIYLVSINETSQQYHTGVQTKLERAVSLINVFSYQLFILVY